MSNIVRITIGLRDKRTIQRSEELPHTTQAERLKWGIAKAKEYARDGFVEIDSSDSVTLHLPHTISGIKIQCI